MNDNLELTPEALNLTDEYQDQYVDRRRTGCRTTTTRGGSTWWARASSSRDELPRHRGAGADAPGAPRCTRRRQCEYSRRVRDRMERLRLQRSRAHVSLVTHVQRDYERPRARDAARQMTVGPHSAQEHRRRARDAGPDLHGAHARGADRRAKRRRALIDLACESVERAEDHLRRRHAQFQRGRRRQSAHVRGLLPQRVHARGTFSRRTTPRCGDVSRRRGPLETARIASQAAQQARVRIRHRLEHHDLGVGKKATLRGAWLDIRGTAGVANSRTNIIIRNLTSRGHARLLPAVGPDGRRTRLLELAVRQHLAAGLRTMSGSTTTRCATRRRADETLPQLFRRALPGARRPARHHQRLGPRHGRRGIASSITTRCH